MGTQVRQNRRGNEPRYPLQKYNRHKLKDKKTKSKTSKFKDTTSEQMLVYRGVQPLQPQQKTMTETETLNGHTAATSASNPQDTMQQVSTHRNLGRRNYGIPPHNNGRKGRPWYDVQSQSAERHYHHQEHLSDTAPRRKDWTARDKAALY